VTKIQEQHHILSILIKVKEALERKDYIKIKHLSNRFVHHSSIHQDADVISVAVIIYALSKLVEREDYKKEKNWDQFYKEYKKNIGNMIVALKNKDEAKFHYEIDSNRKLLEKLSGNLKYYIKDVFRRARINKASRIYEHGISMGKTAKILGISLWELSEYTGRTRIGDVNLGITMPLKDRVKLAQEIFR